MRSKTLLMNKFKPVNIEGRCQKTRRKMGILQYRTFLCNYLRNKSKKAQTKKEKSLRFVRTSINCHQEEIVHLFVAHLRRSFTLKQPACRNNLRKSFRILWVDLLFIKTKWPYPKYQTVRIFLQRRTQERTLIC